MRTDPIRVHTYSVHVLGANEKSMRFRIMALTKAEAESIGMDLGEMAEGFGPTIATARLMHTNPRGLDVSPLLPLG